MEIKELVEKSFQNAKEHGFWEDVGLLDHLNMKSTDYSKMLNNIVGNRLMLIVSELGEAEEGLRHNDMNNFKEELADTAIRLADLCGGLGIDLEAEIIKKMKINEKRPYKHGKEF